MYFGYNAFREKCLNAHNEYRKPHGVPPIKLNPQVSQVSQQWAQHLINTDSFKHSNNKQYLENLYECSKPNNTLSGKELVESWYNEIKEYNFNNGSFNGATGRFTQVVWKNSTEMGVGIAKHGEKVVVCANYYPRGNYEREFAENVPRPM